MSQQQILKAREVTDAEMTAMRIAARSEFLRLPNGPVDYSARCILGHDGFGWVVSEVFEYHTGNVTMCFWSKCERNHAHDIDTW